METQRPEQHDFESHIVKLLQRERGINPSSLQHIAHDGRQGIPHILSSIAASLEDGQKHAEATALKEALERITSNKQFGGLGISMLNVDQPSIATIIGVGKSFARLSDNLLNTPQRQGTDDTRTKDTGTTFYRKNINKALMGGSYEVEINAVYENDLRSPGIWRNDRFWLAADHVVHPAAAKTSSMRDLIDRAEKTKSEFKMTEYQGLNYTIMHTEFVRERAEPGMLVIGADSHTCSGGAVGCLAIGLGGVDVLMGLILGETWFKVPESILVEFHGRPAPGITGKEVILHILKELKRNTVATDRIVEFGGEGAKYLSCDARFTVCNMATEFGAISGIFIPDCVTMEFISRRRSRRYRKHSIYFRPDDDAYYAGKYVVDLSVVEPTIALYPSPDNVVPVTQRIGMPLDGVFIGACTTTEEELVLGALVLKVGLNQGLRIVPGKRHYVPGSLPIVAKLESLGLLGIYAQAGFTRGPPGCSYCLGLSVDRAGEGETWLSSQNRNFQNRMGRGSLGHLSSAVVCAASSFCMSVTDPRPFMQDLDYEFLQIYKDRSSNALLSDVSYMEPTFPILHKSKQSVASLMGHELKDPAPEDTPRPALPVINSKIVRLGGFIDTDALAPGPSLTSCVTDEDFGRHVLEYTRPDFRGRVRGGQRVVVSDHAFGCGSSREAAVLALKGVGIEAVIARSFAFIFNRNMRTLGLLGFTITDNAFYEALADGDAIHVDVVRQIVVVNGKQFAVKLGNIERELIARQGAVEGYKLLGRDLWEEMTTNSSSSSQEPLIGMLEEPSNGQNLEW
ncbi:uncharacterized protein N7515_007613 [Penicillium bovifimosum]|uniref:Aconitase n=1 Tax=Penicillium bovifimosum TaxID=126998 RepID=A0A9W9GYF5_9EURO|nr:uncharacterized protein N7515_007613 [Penicillium bovifimosum]KAJ5131574.1 hypothetical protein N7515_007613 [Penicillium bovifimosum]